ERDDRQLVLRAVGHVGDEAFEARSNVADVVARRLTVVDEDGDLHRVVGRDHAKHFAWCVVLAHHQVGWAEVGNRYTGLVQGADVHRALDGLRVGSGDRNEHRRSEQQCGIRGSNVHPISIGPGFPEASRKSTARNGLKSESCGDSWGLPRPAVFLTPPEAHAINPTAFAIHHLQFTIYKETARAGARRNALTA